MYIELVPLKGGVGTSTIAAAIASQLSYMGRDTCIVVFTDREHRDQQSIWGSGHHHELPQCLRQNNGTYGEVTLETGDAEADRYWLRLADLDDPDDVIAIRPLDAITSVYDDHDFVNPNAIKRIGITEQSYIGLSNFTITNEKFAAAIVMGKPNPVLTMKDCETVINLKNVFTWSYDDGVLRAVDAGLWAGRIDRHRFRDHMPIIKYLTKGMNIRV